MSIPLLGVDDALQFFKFQEIRGLAAQFQRVEQELSVSQEEEFAHATENQYIPVEVDINVYDDSADRF